MHGTNAGLHGGGSLRNHREKTFEAGGFIHQISRISVKQLFPVELWLAVCALYALRSARKCYLEECDA